MNDMVNHPKHYCDTPFGLEVIEITQHYNFCLGNALKYTLRADKKWDAIEDLKKAVWYLNKEIENREKGVYNGENKQKQNEALAETWTGQKELFPYAFIAPSISVDANGASGYNRYTVTHSGGNVFINSANC